VLHLFEYIFTIDMLDIVDFIKLTAL